MRRCSIVLTLLALAIAACTRTPQVASPRARGARPEGGPVAAPGGVSAPSGPNPGAVSTGGVNVSADFLNPSTGGEFSDSKTIGRFELAITQAIALSAGKKWPQALAAFQ